VPVTEEKAPERSTESQAWRPFESLRREVYRLFEDFDRDLRRPLRRSTFDDLAAHPSPAEERCFKYKDKSRLMPSSVRPMSPLQPSSHA
jgi:hypothetical protein